MAEPSKKAEGLEAFHKAVFKFDRRKLIESNKCAPAPIGCGGDAKEFRDDLSRREYSISALCQNCQDAFYNSPER